MLLITSSFSAARAVQLADVLAAFPLAGSGSFHFRFQTQLDGGPRYLDLLGAADAVPTVAGGHVFAKVLRLDTLTSQARPGASASGLLALRSLARPVAAAASASPSPSSSSSSRFATASATSSTASSASASGSAGAVAASSAVAFLMPSMRQGQALHEVPKEEDGNPHIRDDGRDVDLYSGLKRTDANGMRPVRSVAQDEGPVEVPDEVDGDLEGKSDLVKSRVMARRAELRRVQAGRQLEMDAAASSELREAEEKDAARREFEKRINTWALEPLGGKPREIRTLLVTLQSVLWEGSGWEPIGLDKVVVPSRVRLHFMRACTKVHPDKQSALNAGQRFVATQVFSILTTAFRDFEERELRK